MRNHLPNFCLAASKKKPSLRKVSTKTAVFFAGQVSLRLTFDLVDPREIAGRWMGIHFGCGGPMEVTSPVLVI